MKKFSDLVKGDIIYIVNHGESDLDFDVQIKTIEKVLVDNGYLNFYFTGDAEHKTTLVPITSSKFYTFYDKTQYISYYANKGVLLTDMEVFVGRINSKIKNFNSRLEAIIKSLLQ